MRDSCGQLFGSEIEEIRFTHTLYICITISQIKSRSSSWEDSH